MGVMRDVGCDPVGGLGGCRDPPRRDPQPEAGRAREAVVGSAGVGGGEVGGG